MLDGIEKAARVPAELLEFVGEELINVSHEAFDAARSPEGEAWQPWSSAYAKRPYDKGGPKISVLQRDLPLRRSIAYELRNGKLYIGSNMVYARAHQMGYEKRGLPARPYIGIPADFEDRVLSDPAITGMFE